MDTRCVREDGRISNENEHDFMRGWTWEDGFYAPLPYEKVGDKYDLDRINSVFLERWKQRVRGAGRHELYLSVLLFQGWSVLAHSGSRSPSPWWRHPDHSNNNVNGILVSVGCCFRMNETCSDNLPQTAGQARESKRLDHRRFHGAAFSPWAARYPHM